MARVAVAAEAAEGIGRAVGSKLAAAGLDVVVCDLNGYGMQGTAPAAIELDVQAIAVVADVADEGAVEGLALSRGYRTARHVGRQPRTYRFLDVAQDAGVGLRPATNVHAPDSSLGIRTAVLSHERGGVIINVTFSARVGAQSASSTTARARGDQGGDQDSGQARRQARHQSQRRFAGGGHTHDRDHPHQPEVR